jgi:hypothetical protein
MIRRGAEDQEASLTELAVAVREFLQLEIIPAAAGRQRYLAIVASRALGIIERGLADAGAAEHAHDEYLHAMAAPSDAELAAMIRSDAMTARRPELAAEVLADLTRQLAIVNPRYRDDSAEAPMGGRP